MFNVSDWVEVDRWPLSPIMGQITAIDSDTATIINFHGSKKVQVKDIIEKFDPLARYANDPQGVPPFITDRLMLTGGE